VCRQESLDVHRGKTTSERYGKRRAIGSNLLINLKRLSEFQVLLIITS